MRRLVSLKQGRLPLVVTKLIKVLMSTMTPRTRARALVSNEGREWSFRTTRSRWSEGCGHTIPGGTVADARDPTCRVFRLRPRLCALVRRGRPAACYADPNHRGVDSRWLPVSPQCARHLGTTAIDFATANYLAVGTRRQARSGNPSRAERRMARPARFSANSLVGSTSGLDEFVAENDLAPWAPL